jgi:hypothetical protein
MNQVHLTAEEIDLILTGEGLTGDRADHLGGCAACRRRLAELTAAITGARKADPGELVLARARRAALAAPRRRSSAVRWWLAAAAALVLVTLLSVLVVPALRSRPKPVDTDAVLLDVDRVLAQDPLAAMADERVLNVVVTDTPGAAPTSS